MAMQYYEAPPDVFEETEAMRILVEKAVGASLRAKKAKPKIKPVAKGKKKG